MTWAVQKFELVKEMDRQTFSFGLETESAILGEYGGFYVFGLTSSLARQFANFHLSMGGTLGSGGGAGAPDGDGIMWRAYSAAHYAITPNIKAGFQGNIIDFPSGDINSRHLSLSLQYIMPYQWKPQSTLSLYRVAVEPIFGMHLADARDAAPNRTGSSIYAGIRFSQELSTHASGELQLAAAGYGPLDGYMNYSLGTKWKLPLSFGSVFARTHLASGGGGGANTQGGLAYHMSTGIEYGMITASVGQWAAFQGGMRMPQFEVGLVSELRSNFGFVRSGANSTNWAIDDLNLRRIGVLGGVRRGTHNGVDKNGVPYAPMSSIFLGLYLPVEMGKITLNAAGETLWAASGNYGAYAEGMFGGYLDVDFRKWLYGFNTSVTIAGGGGIDVGNGTGFAFGVHAGYKVSDVGHIRCIFRKKSFGPTAYSPVLFGVQWEQLLPVFTL